MPARDIAYTHATTRMLGHFVSPETEQRLPAILLIHGAHGLDAFMRNIAQRLAGPGFAVLAVDLWGDRAQPEDQAEIGARIGGCVSNRADWMARLEAARLALIAQPEVDADRIAALGYCFGGSTVLEFIRTGGQIRAGVSFHGGLDLVADDWPAATSARVLICSGAADPMARSDDLRRITSAMDASGMSYEINLYGGVLHAFTEPDVPGRPPFAKYDGYADHRSWAAMTSFFKDILA